eukprot:scaffold133865_cov16-Tisochrysis_lutea.AAC.1
MSPTDAACLEEDALSNLETPCSPRLRRDSTELGGVSLYSAANMGGCAADRTGCCVMAVGCVARWALPAGDRT